MLRALYTCLLGFVGLLTPVRGNVMVYPQELPHSLEQEFRDMPAGFGPELPPEGLRGFLVAGEPPDGCGPLNKPPADYDNFTGKWIVLVARYNCSFEVKVRNAQAAGYDCAIVHNVNSSALETMSANNPDGIVIPSVFVSDNAGFMLFEDYLYPYRYFIMVNGDLPFNINTNLLLPFGIVVVLCLFVILIFLIVKCINDRRRARRHRLPNRSLKKIPTCKFSKGDPYETCAICLDDYQEGERLRVLPCAHAYHTKCIDPWLTQNRRVCPVCKRRVRAAGERRAPRSDSDSDDTEPLVADPPPTTQGGTFDEQRENPFVRAARYISRLRGRNENREVDTEVAHPSEEHDETEYNQETPDTQALIQPAESERRRSGRRSRRSRRPHSAPRAHSEHSINATPTATEGEIGVAALPAASNSGPRHMHA